MSLSERACLGKMSFGNILSVQDKKKLFSKFIHGIHEFWLQLWMIFIYFKENLKVQHILICFIVTEVDPGTVNDREGGGVGAKFPPLFTSDMFFSKLHYWQI